MKKEHLGAFIDAVYAIAITILVLELPLELENKKLTSLQLLLYGFNLFFQYALSFTILFALWLKHREINELQTSMNRSYVMISALIMLIATMIPWLTSLSFKHGGDPGTIFDMNISEALDALFMTIILVIDFLFGRATFNLKLPDSIEHPNHQVIVRLKQRKILMTILFILMTIAVLLLPFVDRRILWFVAILLFLEEEIDILIPKLIKITRRIIPQKAIEKIADKIKKAPPQ